MFNLFKRNAKHEVVVAEPKVITKGKTTNQIIEEIHESFFTEVDRLLADAKISKSLETDKQDLLDKCERLRKLGFTNTKEVIEAQKEIERLNILKKENANKGHVIRAIEYFSVAYPNYKFITEDSVKKICSKYNLIYGNIKNYIGTVPDKNLKHIEDFTVKQEDVPYIEQNFRSNSWGTGSTRKIVPYTETHEFKAKLKIPVKTSDDDIQYEWALRTQMMNMRNIDIYHDKCPLEIAAPVKDFDMKGMEVKDFKISKIEIPDPVVLQPVYFDGQKHYLVVTAWGLEANDELVVNNQMN